MISNYKLAEYYQKIVQAVDGESTEYLEDEKQAIVEYPVNLCNLYVNKGTLKDTDLGIVDKRLNVLEEIISIAVDSSSSDGNLKEVLREAPNPPEGTEVITWRRGNNSGEKRKSPYDASQWGLPRLMGATRKRSPYQPVGISRRRRAREIAKILPRPKNSVKKGW